LPIFKGKNHHCATDLMVDVFTFTVGNPHCSLA
jgi:hypothetical protein